MESPQSLLLVDLATRSRLLAFYTLLIRSEPVLDQVENLLLSFALVQLHYLNHEESIEMGIIK